jgi:PAS domain S-box-containing protein
MCSVLDYGSSPDKVTTVIDNRSANYSRFRFPDFPARYSVRRTRFRFYRATKNEHGSKLDSLSMVLGYDLLGMSTFEQQGRQPMPPNRLSEDKSAVDLKRAEDALRDSDDRYRTLFELAPIAVYCCDASGVILDYNNRAAELWGRKPERGDTDERFCGSFKLYRPDGSFMPHEQCPMRDVLTGKIPGTHDAEVHIERPDGSRIIVIVNIAPLTNGRGEIIGAINCFYDVTERKQVEEELRSNITERARVEEALRENEVQLRLANEKLDSLVQMRTTALRHLSVKLMRSQDEERRKIARNLHDSLGQHLAAIKMNLESLSRSDTKDDDKLSAAMESVNRSIIETRTLSSLLHPPLLDEVGFVSVARWYSAEFAKRSGIKVKLDLPDGRNRLPESTEIALYRILQESLTNVHRHSGSPLVDLGLKITENQVQLIVRDFGCGIPAVLGLNHAGVGLSGMRERVADLGGSFDIESDSNGTAVIVKFPLAAEPAGESNQAKNLGKNLAA